MSAGGQDGGQRGAESHEPDASESCRVCVAMMGGRNCQLLCDILRSRTSSGLRQCFFWVGAQRPPLHPHLGRFGGARVPSGCPLRTSPAKSVWLTTSRASGEKVTDGFCDLIYFTIASHQISLEWFIIAEKQSVLCWIA